MQLLCGDCVQCFVCNCLAIEFRSSKRSVDAQTRGYPIAERLDSLIYDYTYLALRVNDTVCFSVPR